MTKQAGFAKQKEKEKCAGEVGKKRLGRDGIAEEHSARCWSSTNRQACTRRDMLKSGDKNTRPTDPTLDEREATFAIALGAAQTGCPARLKPWGSTPGPQAPHGDDPRRIAIS
jgi:hypothetical protein